MLYYYIIIYNNRSVCTGDESFEDVSVNCEAGAMVVSVPVCAFTNDHLNLETVQLIKNGPSCESVTSGSNIVFNLPLIAESCGTSLLQNDTHLIYSNAISAAGGQNKGPISRQGSIGLRFACALASGK